MSGCRSGAGSWWDDDVELARLRYDSAIGRPSAPGPRTLTFAGCRLTVELEVARDGVHGRLLPPQPATVEVRPEAVEVRPEAGTAADAEPGGTGCGGTGCGGTADAAGRFSIAATPAGAVRLRVVPATGIPIVTDPVELTLG
jgi:hypothetical protein